MATKQLLQEEQSEEQNSEQGKNHGNTRLPFGLCERYGIRLSRDATPRDAWNALKGVGITPEMGYEIAGKDEIMQSPNTAKAKSASINEQIEKMLKDDRIVYSKKFPEQRFRNNLNAGTEEMRGLTVDLFNNDSFGYNTNERETAYFFGFNKLCILEKDD